MDISLNPSYYRAPASHKSGYKSPEIKSGIQVRFFGAKNCLRAQKVCRNEALMHIFRSKIYVKLLRTVTYSFSRKVVFYLSKTNTFGDPRDSEICGHLLNKYEQTDLEKNTHTAVIFSEHVRTRRTITSKRTAQGSMKPDRVAHTKRTLSILPKVKTKILLPLRGIFFHFFD